MDAAIYYAPDGYTSNGEKIMGRQAAGAGFLRAAAQSNASNLACHTTHVNLARDFSTQLQNYGFRGQTEWIPAHQAEKLSHIGCLYTPDPGLTDFAWRRRATDESAYSICGVTHTTASHTAMSSIVQLLTAPIQSWDALICTSTVVQETVKFLFAQQADYLHERLGAKEFKIPELPIIPLGVHCSDYDFSLKDCLQARQNLDIAPDEIVLLFVGRLSFHAKAHPLQMYTALERVAKKTVGQQRIRLIQCGWFANEHLQAAFVDGAKILCPSIKIDYLDGNNIEARKNAWACADIFISLSDNIQETFGLTPIEAMAAGLPVIVSDWNGYKDTVRHQVDGFRIPTLTPIAPLGDIFARHYDTGELTYDMYCGYTSQYVAMDPVELETACFSLITDVTLRKRLGASGQQRAREEFDWSVIYRRYQTLWDELAERRRAAPVMQKKPRKRPDRLDPFALFANYPTTQIREGHQVSLFHNLTPNLNERRKLAMNHFADAIHPKESVCDFLIQALAEMGPCSVGMLLTHFPAEERMNMIRELVWLAKMEVVRITPPTIQ